MGIVVTSFLKVSNFLFRAKRKALHTFKTSLRPSEIFLRNMKQILSSQRLTSVDIGGAIDLQPHWYKILGNSDFHIFEPHPRSYEDLKTKYGQSLWKDHFHIYQTALSGAGGKRTLSMTNGPTGSTIIPINFDSPYIDRKDASLFPLKNIEIDTYTLDQALSQYQVKNVDLIKLDIQGADLEVLKGLGGEKVQNLLCFEMEVHLHDTYVGGTNLTEVSQFAMENDFELFDVRVARGYIMRNGKSEELKNMLGVKEYSPSVSAKSWEFDVIYFKKPNRLLKGKNCADLRRLIASYCVYNFFMEAVGLAKEAQESGIFSSPETSEIIGAVKAMKTCMDRELKGYFSTLNGQKNMNWGQYMWMHYPST